MKRLLFGLIVVGVAYAVPAVAAPPNLNWGAKVNSGQCSTDGQLLINVTSRVTNSIDSGVRGNYWAVDNYNKNIQVWTTSDPAVFCARVLYLGQFTGVAGYSPGGTGTLAGGEKGSFEGGYWATITNASLKSTPGWKMRGNVGSFDYACHAASGTCDAAVNWLAQYFDSYTFTYNWWGWTYHAGRNGAWVNSSDGNQGDIVDK